MAARDSVAQLIIDLKTQGLGDIQFLRKELKQVSSQSKISEKSIGGLQKEITKFSAATKNSINGLKGQISAFQKLRAQTGFQGKAYNSLTNDIVRLNRELERRLGLEREIDSGVRRRASRTTPPSGDKSLLASPLGGAASGGTEQFAQRQAALSALLVTRTFDTLTKAQQDFLHDFKRSTTKGTYDISRLGKAENAQFRELVAKSNAAYLAGEAKHKGRGLHDFLETDLVQKGKLNDIQKAALNITDELAITSERYLEVLTKINAETGVQARLLGSKDAQAANRTAIARANIITSTDAVAQQSQKARSFLYQQELGSYTGAVRPPRIVDTSPGPSELAFKAKNPFAQYLQNLFSMLGPDWQSDTYKGMMAERSRYPRKTRLDKTSTARIPAPFIGPLDERTTVSAIQAMGEKRKRILDPMGLGGDPKYPRTESGLGAELKNLKEMLPELENGTKPWLAINEKVEEKQKEINKLIETGNKAIEARKKKIAETVNPKVNQKLLPAAGQTSGTATVKQLQSRLAASYAPAQFTAEQYGPQLETQDQLITRLQKTIKVRTNSIQTITEHRNKLEEIRKTLAPTSAKFKSVANSIEQADKSLAKLNKTSKGFGKQGLLGFGQSVLGCAYFGGPFGALGAGIGQVFGGPSGAATGGLVGSQIGRPITEFIGGSTDYAAQYSKAEKTLKLITKDAGSYEVAMKAVKTAVEEYNVPQEVAIRGMTRLSAAVLGSGGNVNNAAEAFLNTTAAIKGTAGSADDVKSAITAMVQIYSKGKVSAEELSGQLGERFPAAVTKFADANNISTQELQKNLKDGTVGLDMLSKFVESLGAEYAPLAKKIAESNEEAGARSRVAMNKLRIEVGNTLIPVGKQFQEIGANLMLDLIPALTKLAQIGGSTFAVLASSISVVVDNFDKLAPVIAGATVALIAHNIQVQIANKTGLVLMARNALAAMIRLRRAIVSATISQAAFNATVKANAYVIAASAIAGMAVALFNLKRAADSLNETEIFEGFDSMSLDETKAALEDVKKLIERNREILKNPTGLIGKDGTILLTAKEQAKMASKNLKGLNDELLALQTRIVELTGKHNYEGLIGGGNEVYEGLAGGVKKFTDSVKNMGEEVANVTASWFDRMADSLANFVMTGKLQFKEFARSIIADIAKMIAKQMIFNAISGFKSLNWFGGGPSGGPKTTTVGQVVGVTAANGKVFAQNGIVPYAKGGIVNSPTLFPFAKGTGLMGEAGPEAIVPLKRGRDGKLGIAGGGGATTVNVSVDAKGTKVEGDGKQMAQLGRMIGSAIEMELAKQKRPGGLLA